MLPAGARKKTPPIHQAFRWDPDIRDLIKQELQKRVTPVTRLSPWLESALIARFSVVDPFPDAMLKIAETPELIIDGKQQEGIFANQNISRGTLVAKYRGDVTFDSDPRAATDRAFAVAIAPDVTMTVTSTGWPSKFNHCWMWPLPNEENVRGFAPAAWQPYFANLVIDDELQLWAIRDIPVGEQLCFDYGLAFWIETPFKPLWNVANAPEDFLQAINTVDQLRLLALASAVRLEPQRFFTITI